jgi:hypothetical protein
MAHETINYGLHTEMRLIAGLFVAANAVLGSLSAATVPVPDKVACIVTDRQAINRSTSLLEEAWDQLGRLHPVLQRFAAHLKKYLLGPSLAGSAPAGHLVYEPPRGVQWVQPRRPGKELKYNPGLRQTSERQLPRVWATLQSR